MISIEEIKKAREVIRDTVVHTPVLELELPDPKTNLFLKCVCRRYDLTVTQIILTEGVRYIYCSIEKMG